MDEIPQGRFIEKYKLENTPTGTTICNLCRKGIKHIQQHLYRIHGNGMRIFLWDVNILGHPPLSSLNSLNEIKMWLTNKGFLWLAYICSWDSNRNWVGWTFLEMPEPLIPIQNLLITALSGMAPVHRYFKD